MPGNDKIVLVRKDGTRLEATPEQAGRLALLGYTEQTPEQAASVLKTEAVKDYYSTGTQQAITALEGVNAGLSFGITDYLSGEDTKKRAQHNPGTRLATEVVGAVAPLVLSGGSAGAVTTVERIAAKAPSSLLADAAAALAPGAKGGFTNAVVRGAIEGGVYGGAGAANHAYLEGDPVTAETILHGVGWGSLIGGALSGAGSGLETYGKRVRAAAKAEEDAIRVAETREAALAANKTNTDKARYEAQLKLAQQRAKPAVPIGALKQTAGSQFGALRDEVNALAVSAKGATKAADDAVEAVLDQARNQVFSSNMAGFDAARVGNLAGRTAVEELEFSLTQARSLYKKVTQAVDSGKFLAAKEASEQFTKHISEFGTKIEASANMAGPLVFDTTMAVKPLDELIKIRSVQAEISSFPKSVEQFATMSPAKFERTMAALEAAQGLPLPNVTAINDAATNFSKAMGISAQDLRSTWRAAKDLYKSEGSKAVPFIPPKPAKTYDPRPVVIDTPHSEPSLARRVAAVALGGKAYVAATAMGVGRVGSYAAYRGVKDAVTYSGRDLAGVRGATIGRLHAAVGSFSPSAGNAIKKAGPVAAKAITPKSSNSALAMTIFGEPDNSSKDPKTLALNRVREINKFNTTASDSIYRALEPLAAIQPKLTPALHAAGLKAFQALAALAPKDPGVINKLQSIWKPSDLGAAILAKQLEVFHDPIGVASQMLEAGQFDPVKIEAMKQVAPESWQILRTVMLEKLSQPGVLDRVSYREQVGISALLDLAIHSSMQPEFIATSQQMFLDRDQPLKANPRMGAGGGVPDLSTPSQKTTER